MARGGAEPVFAQPWQACAFALAVSLSRQGHFTWSEWTRVFADERHASALRGEEDSGATYFLCWLAALERLVIDRKLSDAPTLAELKNAWADAYRRTPHGQPVELKSGHG
jgi:nitrile hydratase accessory protein